MNTSKLFLVIALIFAVVIYTQITLFVTQPVGVIPEGTTWVILKLPNTKFIDSADAMCKREFGEVNLICRLAVLGGVATNSKILVRLPYSSTLYKFSTGGRTYEN